MKRRNPIGWQNITPTLHTVSSQGMALYYIQQIYPAAYELPAGKGFACRVPWENASKLVALAWPHDHPPLWSYACMSPTLMEAGLSFSFSQLDDGRLRVYPGSLAPPVPRPVKKSKMSNAEDRITGWRLRKTRLQHHMTQAGLAERIKQTGKSHYRSADIIEQLISRFERGQHIAYAHLLLELAEDVLGSLGSETPADNLPPASRIAEAG